MEHKEKKAKYQFLVRFLIKTVILIGILMITFTFVFQIHRMNGNRMFPSVRDGDLGVFYRLEPCYTNDVVLYKDHNGELQVGRIIAVPEQTVEFLENGGYEVNGNQTLDEIPYETYLEHSSQVKYPLTLSSDSYFILNDFRSDTSDSRTYGVVEKSEIRGKLLFLLRRRGF